MNKFFASIIVSIAFLCSTNAAADGAGALVDANGIMTSNPAGTNLCVEVTGGPSNGVACSTALLGGGDSVCAPLNGGLGCSGTEQLLADYSLDCYACMVNAGAIDDGLFGDSGNECEDVAGTAENGAQKDQTRANLCSQALQCALATTIPSSDPALLYCGSLGNSACCTSSNPSAANGPCKTIELAAIEHSSTEAPSEVVPDFYNPNLGGGQANIVFSRAQTGGCASACPFLQ